MVNMTSALDAVGIDDPQASNWVGQFEGTACFTVFHGVNVEVQVTTRIRIEDADVDIKVEVPNTGFNPLQWMATFVAPESWVMPRSYKNKYSIPELQTCAGVDNVFRMGLERYPLKVVLDPAGDLLANKLSMAQDILVYRVTISIVDITITQKGKDGLLSLDINLAWGGDYPDTRITVRAYSKNNNMNERLPAWYSARRERDGLADRVPQFVPQM